MLKKLPLLLAAASMPLVSWLSQRQVFGPDNGTVSDRYPTLMVAAGYAFAIWGLIFALDVAFGIWQSRSARADQAPVRNIRWLVVLGFLLTASWMVVFPMQLFWLALVIIWAAFAALCAALLKLARTGAVGPVFWWALVPLALHTGWLSLAVFLNTAQVVVAYGLLSTSNMLPWTLLLWALAGALLLVVNARLARGNLVFAGAALWGLAGVAVRQSQSSLTGADVSAWVAVALAGLLLVQTIYLHRMRLRLASTGAAVAA